MTKRYFNDSPIESAGDDEYGITPFAESLAKSILKIEDPVGTTIALNGEWGTGKSSAVNLVRAELDKAADEKLVVTEFKCWWFRGEEALALAFLQNLHTLLTHSLKDKVKDLIPKLGRGILQAGPVIGAAVSISSLGFLGPLAGASTNFAKRFFSDGETLEDVFLKLAKILEEQDQRFLMIIDDIDRLSPDEALAIFRVVKSVGRLPNVMYLLVFDRTLAEKAVEDRYPSEGPHFLEKIIQAGFELPAPLRTDLNRSILSSIETICGVPDESEHQRILNLFYDIVAPYLTTPRHVARFQNAISVTWPAIANEVNLADFIALETLRLYEPQVFNTIRSNKTQLCGLNDGYRQRDARDEDRFAPYLKGVHEDRRDTIKTALQRLFPRLEEMGYGDGFRSAWNAERRVCTEAHFDTYFRLSLSDETLSISFVNDLIDRAADKQFIQTAFREAANKRRKTGTSLVPVLLDELNTHALRVAPAHVEPLLNALFEIHDEIDLEIDRDRGMMAIANTSLRFHWLIRRLTLDRFSLDQRTSIYLKAIKTASLGWLVDFAATVRRQHEKNEDKPPPREEDLLVNKSAVAQVENLALEKVRGAAALGSLLEHKDLIYLLYRWRDFADDDSDEVIDWTTEQLNNPDAVVVLARKLTGESWSHGIGMFGLGDRVAKRHTRAQLEHDSKILNSDKFIEQLRSAQTSGKLDEDDQRAVDTFLAAWQRKLDGEDE